MRNAFADEISSIAKDDDRVVLLSGDIGNRLFDEFKTQYPNRFYNCGVAEANMTSMASGMALCGLKPVTYTIASFNTFRCIEQIKLDICYHNLPVIIVGVGAGLSYANLGTTHHSCEDIAMLRSLPNMSVVCPGDALELRAALREAFNLNTPVYLRIGKKNEPVVHNTIPDLKIGRGIVIRQCSGITDVTDTADIAILSTGTILPNAVECADILEKNNLSVQVVSMHTVKPIDTELLSDIFERFKLVVTLEEHGACGGFGSCVAEWLADSNFIENKRNNIANMDNIRADNADFQFETNIINPKLYPKFLRFNSGNKFLHQSGSQKNAHKILGLSPTQIAEKIFKIYSQLLHERTAVSCA